MYALRHVSAKGETTEVNRLLSQMVAVIMVLGAAGTARAGSPFDDAVAVWHLSDLNAPPRKHGTLQVHGKVQLGIELTDAEREESLRRGGDGRVARFDGGWLMIGKGANEALALKGNALTICLRLRDPSGKWAAGLLSKKGVAKNYNLFAWNLGRGMEFGFEFNLHRQRAFTQVATPLQGLALDGWHDLVVRYNGLNVELFVNGILRDQKAASGKIVEASGADFLIGADPGGQNVFRGLIDHAALWNRALTDAEIEYLSGGREAVERARAVELAGAGRGNSRLKRGCARPGDVRPRTVITRSTTSPRRSVG